MQESCKGMFMLGMIVTFMFCMAVVLFESVIREWLGRIIKHKTGNKADRPYTTIKLS